MDYSVGQKIVLTNNYNKDDVLTVGKTYEVAEVDKSDSHCPIRVINDDGDLWWLSVNQFRVEGNSDELAELRAFKAAALARFPALAEPETDEQAMARFWRYYTSDEKAPRDIIFEAFAWARANPR